MKFKPCCALNRALLLRVWMGAAFDYASRGCWRFLTAFVSIAATA
jgi:hypothetical protein